MFQPIYLRINIGRKRKGTLNDLSEGMIREAEKILASGLTDWLISEHLYPDQRQLSLQCISY